jgi:hypothetical protein
LTYVGLLVGARVVLPAVVVGFFEGACVGMTTAIGFAMKGARVVLPAVVGDGRACVGLLDAFEDGTTQALGEVMFGCMVGTDIDPLLG